MKGTLTGFYSKTLTVFTVGIWIGKGQVVIVLAGSYE
jgi:hypothetical protein